MRRLAQALAFTLVGLSLAAAGCGGRPYATIQYLAGGMDETATYDVAVYQLARNDKVQIILYRRVAAPVGTADPDFEYVFFELPEAETYGWLPEDNVPAYRWIHRDGRNQIWKATSGQVSEWMSNDKTSMRFGFEATMDPVADTSGASHIFSGTVRLPEDVVKTQGLMNRYDEWLRTLLGEKPQPPPTTTKPATSPGAKGSHARLGADKPIR